MTQRMHPCARTTMKMRREIQDSDEPLRALAARLGVNPKTVAKWRRRRSTQDASKGPKRNDSTILAPSDEALIVVYRRRMKTTIDDCYLGLKGAIPHLSRSALHRCLQRHGLGRIPRGNTQKLVLPDYCSTYFSMENYKLPPSLGGGFLLFAISDCNNLVFAKKVMANAARGAAALLFEMKEKSSVHVVCTDACEAFVAIKEAPLTAQGRERTHPFGAACKVCEVGQVIDRSRRPEPRNVLDGWRGAGLKNIFQVYREKGGRHYWRLVLAEDCKLFEAEAASLMRRAVKAVSAPPDVVKALAEAQRAVERDKTPESPRGKKTTKPAKENAAI
jgi:hypothetical protein